MDTPWQATQEVLCAVPINGAAGALQMSPLKPAFQRRPRGVAGHHSLFVHVTCSMYDTGSLTARQQTTSPMLPGTYNVQMLTRRTPARPCIRNALPLSLCVNKHRLQRSQGSRLQQLDYTLSQGQRMCKPWQCPSTSQQTHTQPNLWRCHIQAGANKCISSTLSCQH